MMYNKKGWMRILEATIAVLIVSGVLLVTYSRQVDRGATPDEYFYSLQREILADISLSSELRLNVLNVVNDDLSDQNFEVIYNFVESEIPIPFGFSIAICDLSSNDYCKMNNEDFIKTRDKNIFVEEVIISSDLGTGGNRKYAPKKLRLFVWEKD